nr:MAG TPA: hypothetical protein [Caudoviricetes sp.]
MRNFCPYVLCKALIKRQYANKTKEVTLYDDDL